MTPPPRRVLLVRLSAMGDVVESLGAVRGLQLARPEWSLALVVQRAIAPLLDGWAGLEVIPHDRSSGWRGLWATGRRLRGCRFDTALDLQGNWKAALLARLSGAPLRLGIHRTRRREPASARLLTGEVGTASRDPAQRHPAAVALEVVRAIAADAEMAQAPLQPTSAEIAAERAALAAVGVDPDQPFALFVWTDPADCRSWRPAAMAASTARSVQPVVWLAGPAEAHLADTSAPAATPVLRHGRGEVRRLLALAELVRRAGGEVAGPDQGATHVLAAAGAPTQVLFGPQDPLATAPRGAAVRLVANPPPCMPCRSRRCTHPDGPVCMAHHLG